MNRGFALFLARLFSNKYKDSMTAHLGATLILGQLNLVPAVAKPLGYLIRCFAGLFQESLIFRIDLTLDAYREGMKLRQFESMAVAAYNKATKKVYSESEKQKIRQEYLQIISLIGNVGNPR